MKFKLDENLPAIAGARMREVGHDVHTVADEQFAGADDALVPSAAVGEGRVLVTLDLGFADIRVYAPGAHAGIRVLRPATQTFAALCSLVESGLRLAAAERVQGQLWVIDETQVRIRDA